MKIIASGKTDKGNVRKNNEDAFCVEHKLGLYAVADGMGGHAAGEVASRMAIDLIRENINGPQAEDVGNPENCSGYSKATGNICSAIKIANQAVYGAAKNDPDLRGMGTTIASVVIKKDRLSIAHAGDSRGYLLRNGDLDQITDDHSLVSEHNLSETSGFENIITRSLGAQPDVNVALNELTLFDGDVLLLCSDGLTGMVSDDVILSTIESTNNADKACEMLIQLAKENGGKDNVTVVVLYIYKRRLLDFLCNPLTWLRGISNG